MNSSGLLEKGKVPSSVPARLLSNWVEVFAIPIAAAIMETQPIWLGLELIRPFLLGGADAQIPAALSVTLSLLVMQWWMMFLQSRKQDGVLNRGGRPALSTLSGLPFAILLIVLFQPFALEDGGFLFASAVLLVWSWYRGVLRANDPLNDGYLTTVFRIGFVVLLVVLGFAILADLDPTNNRGFSGELARSLPIFFLSSLIALSFTRIGKLKREQQRHLGSGGREATGRWLSGMTITWVALVVAAVALEALPLNAIMVGLNPLWLVLSLLGQGILYLVGLVIYAIVFVLEFILGGAMWLLDLVFHFSSAKSTDQVKHTIENVAPVVKDSGQKSPLLTIILAAVVIIVALIVFFTIARKRKRADATAAEEEEVRESLNREEVLQERREQRRKQQDGIALEALDPASMRARYREFLQEMAAQGEETQRLSNETPLEYQRRLLRIARRRHLLRDEQEQDAELLNELTLAYARERYGGEPVDGERQRYLGSRVTKLAQKFASGVVATARPIAEWSAAKARWGED